MSKDSIVGLEAQEKVSFCEMKGLCLVEHEKTDAGIDKLNLMTRILTWKEKTTVNSEVHDIVDISDDRASYSKQFSYFEKEKFSRADGFLEAALDAEDHDSVKGNERHEEDTVAAAESLENKADQQEDPVSEGLSS